MVRDGCYERTVDAVMRHLKVYVVVVVTESGKFKFFLKKSLAKRVKSTYNGNRSTVVYLTI